MKRNINSLMGLLKKSDKQKEYRMYYRLFMCLEDYFNEDYKTKFTNYLGNLYQECIK